MTKNITYLLLLSILSHAGGDILPIELDVDSMIEIKPIINIKVKELKEEKIVQEAINEKNILKEVVKNKERTTNKSYIGLAIASASFDSNINGNSLENGHPFGVIGKAGYFLTDNFALEARLGTGIKTDSINSATNKWKSLYGVYLKPQIELFDNLNAFGLLGYSVLNESVNGTDNRNSGTSYGGGLSYELSKKVNLGIEFVRYTTDKDNDSDAYALGIEYKF